MDKRHYSRHSRKYSRKKRSGDGYFFIRANIALGAVICAFAAVSLGNDTADKALSEVKEVISTNTDTKDILSLINDTNGGIHTFAGEKKNVVLSDAIKNEIENRSGVYERNNKGAPQGG